VKIASVGSGAATIATLRLLLAAGATPGNLRICDSKGLLGPWREDVELVKDEYVDKWRLCGISNATGIQGGIPEAMKGADVAIALSKPEPGTIQKDWVTSMAREPIVFAMANPIPEIWPWDAKDAGARIVATGRSDFPNQVNNSTGFPGIFRGTLDVRAKTITDEMCIAAAMELAKVAQDRGLKDDYITPTMDDWEIFPRVAVAVALKAQEQGITRINASRDELYKNAMAIIKHARDEVQLLMKEGLIAPYNE
jgi:malate dehydrogenase (oxaloacetate-decarboxylating)